MSTPPLAGAGMPPGAFSGTQAQGAREVNTASLCRIGQETVQDIVFRTMEIFQLLRNMQVRNKYFFLYTQVALFLSLTGNTYRLRRCFRMFRKVDQTALKRRIG